jgi:hypothetical protein
LLLRGHLRLHFQPQTIFSILAAPVTELTQIVCRLVANVCCSGNLSNSNANSAKLGTKFRYAQPRLRRFLFRRYEFECNSLLFAIGALQHDQGVIRALSTIIVSAQVFQKSLLTIKLTSHSCSSLPLFLRPNYKHALEQLSLPFML